MHGAEERIGGDLHKLECACILRAVPRPRQLGARPVASSENKVDNILTFKFERLC